MLLLDYARNEVGLPMRGLHAGRHIGWTTDEAKADRMVDAGATVVRGGHADRQEAIPVQVPGWEISFAVGSEYER
jgi:hypothetical protein